MKRQANMFEMAIGDLAGIIQEKNELVFVTQL